jgi:three-Cys-motif partner protein
MEVAHVMPPEYIGREQSWLKHRVLEEYLSGWAHKLGSAGRRRPVRLWYVDCFAGPWRATAEDLRDTSVVIGLTELRKAAKNWADLRGHVQVGAVFVEKNPDSFRRLGELVEPYRKAVEIEVLHGHFGDRLAEIERRIRADAALVLVDPTGWKGAAMANIARLARAPRRDVLINVMYDFLNRFKDDPRAFLREQMTEFFGLHDRELPAELDEDGLMRFYRQRLKRACGLKYAADLAIPHPTSDRTYFRLVVGGGHEAVLELFRDVEHKVAGREASAVVEAAEARRAAQRTGQQSMHLPRKTIKGYEAARASGIGWARGEILRALGGSSFLRYENLWPQLLEECHARELDIRDLLRGMEDGGEVVIERGAGGSTGRERRTRRIDGSDRIKLARGARA